MRSLNFLDSSKRFNFFFLVLPGLLLAGCGGGGNSTSNTPAGTNHVATAVRGTAPLANCPAGGVSVDAGIDINSNSVLDPSEVTSTQYICNGSNGSNGLSTLVSVTSEPAGINCATGGSKVSAGQDANRNDILDTLEVSSTAYVCSGAAGNTGLTGPAGPGVTWVNATSSVQAASNTGYLANSAVQVTITLPAALVIGDAVQVSGIGTGGWKIAQNVGQYIITKDLPPSIGGIWVPRDAQRNWRAVASSADGTKLVAVVGGVAGGQIYTSVDSGGNWNLPTAGMIANWQSVASSADGAKLVAVVWGGQIYTSLDSGATWTLQAGSAVANWQSVASSADGSRLVAVVRGGQIYTSANSGVTWTLQAGSAVANWQSVASSADGSRLVAVVSGGQIYTSVNSGVTWTLQASSPTAFWSDVASSASGSNLVAVISNSSLVYTSNDSGVTWISHQVNAAGFSKVASSADGSRLFVDDYAYSSDFGNTWVMNQNNTTPHNVGSVLALACSADGSKLIGAITGIGGSLVAGQIYTSIPTSIGTTTVGIAGSISGMQYDAIDLQYIGNGVFMVRGFAGNLVVH
ncbi:MAG: hypothetical protein HY938_07950 [Nitrosomonadales bacterium]|nr:hypothetical protein [Nitrosomonadales bacterium]